MQRFIDLWASQGLKHNAGTLSCLKKNLPTLGNLHLVTEMEKIYYIMGYEEFIQRDTEFYNSLTIPKNRPVENIDQVLLTKNMFKPEYQEVFDGMVASLDQDQVADLKNPLVITQIAIAGCNFVPLD